MASVRDHLVTFCDRALFAHLTQPKYEQLSLHMLGYEPSFKLLQVALFDSMVELLSPQIQELSVVNALTHLE